MHSRRVQSARSRRGAARAEETRTTATIAARKDTSHSPSAAAASSPSRSGQVVRDGGGRGIGKPPGRIESDAQMTTTRTGARRLHAALRSTSLAITATAACDPGGARDPGRRVEATTEKARDGSSQSWETATRGSPPTPRPAPSPSPPRARRRHPAGRNRAEGAGRWRRPASRLPTTCSDPSAAFSVVASTRRPRVARATWIRMPPSRGDGQGRLLTGAASVGASSWWSSSVRRSRSWPGASRYLVHPPSRLPGRLVMALLAAARWANAGVPSAAIRSPWCAFFRSAAPRLERALWTPLLCIVAFLVLTPSAPAVARAPSGLLVWVGRPAWRSPPAVNYASPFPPRRCRPTTPRPFARLSVVGSLMIPLLGWLSSSAVFHSARRCLTGPVGEA